MVDNQDKNETVYFHPRLICPNGESVKELNHPEGIGWSGKGRLINAEILHTGDEYSVVPIHKRLKREDFGYVALGSYKVEPDPLWNMYQAVRGSGYCYNLRVKVDGMLNNTDNICVTIHDNTSYSSKTQESAFFFFRCKGVNKDLSTEYSSDADTYVLNIEHVHPYLSFDLGIYGYTKKLMLIEHITIRFVERQTQSCSTHLSRMNATCERAYKPKSWKQRQVMNFRRFHRKVRALVHKHYGVENGNKFARRCQSAACEDCKEKYGIYIHALAEHLYMENKRQERVAKEKLLEEKRAAQQKKQTEEDADNLYNSEEDRSSSSSYESTGSSEEKEKKEANDNNTNMRAAVKHPLATNTSSFKYDCQHRKEAIEKDQLRKQRRERRERKRLRRLRAEGKLPAEIAAVTPSKLKPVFKIATHPVPPPPALTQSKTAQYSNVVLEHAAADVAVKLSPEKRNNNNDSSSLTREALVFTDSIIGSPSMENPSMIKEERGDRNDGDEDDVLVPPLFPQVKGLAPEMLPPFFCSKMSCAGKFLKTDYRGPDYLEPLLEGLLDSNRKELTEQKGVHLTSANEQKFTFLEANTLLAQATERAKKETATQNDSGENADQRLLNDLVLSAAIPAVKEGTVTIPGDYLRDSKYFSMSRWKARDEALDRKDHLFRLAAESAVYSDKVTQDKWICPSCHDYEPYLDARYRKLCKEQNKGSYRSRCVKCNRKYVQEFWWKEDMWRDRQDHQENKRIRRLEALQAVIQAEELREKASVERNRPSFKETLAREWAAMLKQPPSSSTTRPPSSLSYGNIINTPTTVGVGITSKIDNNNNTQSANLQLLQSTVGGARNERPPRLIHSPLQIAASLRQKYSDRIGMMGDCGGVRYRSDQQQQQQQLFSPTGTTATRPRSAFARMMTNTLTGDIPVGGSPSGLLQHASATMTTTNTATVSTINDAVATSATAAAAATTTSAQAASTCKQQPVFANAAEEMQHMLLLRSRARGAENLAAEARNTPAALQSRLPANDPTVHYDKGMYMSVSLAALDAVNKETKLTRQKQFARTLPRAPIMHSGFFARDSEVLSDSEDEIMRDAGDVVEDINNNNNNNSNKEARVLLGTLSERHEAAMHKKQRKDSVKVAADDDDEEEEEEETSTKEKLNIERERTNSDMSYTPGAIAIQQQQGMQPLRRSSSISRGSIRLANDTDDKKMLSVQRLHRQESLKQLLCDQQEQQQQQQQPDRHGRNHSFSSSSSSNDRLGVRPGSATAALGREGGGERSRHEASVPNHNTGNNSVHAEEDEEDKDIKQRDETSSGGKGAGSVTDKIKSKEQPSNAENHENEQSGTVATGSSKSGRSGDSGVFLTYSSKSMFLTQQLKQQRPAVVNISDRAAVLLPPLKPSPVLGGSGAALHFRNVLAQSARQYIGATSESKKATAYITERTAGDGGGGGGQVIMPTIRDDGEEKGNENGDNNDNHSGTADGEGRELKSNVKAYWSVSDPQELRSMLSPANRRGSSSSSSKSQPRMKQTSHSLLTANFGNISLIPVKHQQQQHRDAASTAVDASLQEHQSSLLGGNSLASSFVTNLVNVLIYDEEEETDEQGSHDDEEEAEAEERDEDGVDDDDDDDDDEKMTRKKQKGHSRFGRNVSSVDMLRRALTPVIDDSCFDSDYEDSSRCGDGTAAVPRSSWRHNSSRQQLDVQSRIIINEVAASLVRDVIVNVSMSSPDALLGVRPPREELSSSPPSRSRSSSSLLQNCQYNEQQQQPQSRSRRNTDITVPDFSTDYFLSPLVPPPVFGGHENESGKSREHGLSSFSPPSSPPRCHHVVGAADIQHDEENKQIRDYDAGSHNNNDNRQEQEKEEESEERRIIASVAYSTSPSTPPVAVSSPFLSRGDPSLSQLLLTPDQQRHHHHCDRDHDHEQNQGQEKHQNQCAAGESSTVPIEDAAPAAGPAAAAAAAAYSSGGAEGRSLHPSRRESHIAMVNAAHVYNNHRPSARNSSTIDTHFDDGDDYHHALYDEDAGTSAAVHSSSPSKELQRGEGQQQSAGIDGKTAPVAHATSAKPAPSSSTTTPSGNTKNNMISSTVVRYVAGVSSQPPWNALKTGLCEPVCLRGLEHVCCLPPDMATNNNNNNNNSSESENMCNDNAALVSGFGLLAAQQDCQFDNDPEEVAKPLYTARGKLYINRLSGTVEEMDAVKVQWNQMREETYFDGLLKWNSNESHFVHIATKEEIQHPHHYHGHRHGYHHHHHHHHHHHNRTHEQNAAVNDTAAAAVVVVTTTELNNNEETGCKNGSGNDDLERDQAATNRDDPKAAGNADSFVRTDTAGTADSADKEEVSEKVTIVQRNAGVVIEDHENVSPPLAVDAVVASEEGRTKVVSLPAGPAAGHTGTAPTLYFKPEVDTGSLRDYWVTTCPSIDAGKRQQQQQQHKQPPQYCAPFTANSWAIVPVHDVRPPLDDDSEDDDDDDDDDEDYDDDDGAEDDEEEDGDSDSNVSIVPKKPSYFAQQLKQRKRRTSSIDSATAAAAASVADTNGDGASLTAGRGGVESVVGRTSRRQLSTASVVSSKAAARYRAAELAQQQQARLLFMCVPVNRVEYLSELSHPVGPTGHVEPIHTLDYLATHPNGEPPLTPMHLVTQPDSEEAAAAVAAMTQQQTHKNAAKRLKTDCSDRKSKQSQEQEQKQNPKPPGSSVCVTPAQAGAAYAVAVERMVRHREHKLSKAHDKEQEKQKKKERKASKAFAAQLAAGVGAKKASGSAFAAVKSIKEQIAEATAEAELRMSAQAKLAADTAVFESMRAAEEEEVALLLKYGGKLPVPYAWRKATEETTPERQGSTSSLTATKLSSAAAAEAAAAAGNTHGTYALVVMDPLLPAAHSIADTLTARLSGRSRRGSGSGGTAAVGLDEVSHYNGLASGSTPVTAVGEATVPPVVAPTASPHATGKRSRTVSYDPSLPLLLPPPTAPLSPSTTAKGASAPGVSSSFTTQRLPARFAGSVPAASAAQSAAAVVKPDSHHFRLPPHALCIWNVSYAVSGGSGGSASARPVRSIHPMSPLDMPLTSAQAARRAMRHFTQHEQQQAEGGDSSVGGGGASPAASSSVSIAALRRSFRRANPRTTAIHQALASAAAQAELREALLIRQSFMYVQNSKLQRILRRQQRIRRKRLIAIRTKLCREYQFSVRAMLGDSDVVPGVLFVVVDCSRYCSDYKKLVGAWAKQCKYVPPPVLGVASEDHAEENNRRIGVTGGDGGGGGGGGAQALVPDAVNHANIGKNNQKMVNLSSKDNVPAVVELKSLPNAHNSAVVTMAPDPFVVPMNSSSPNYTGTRRRYSASGGRVVGSCSSPSPGGRSRVGSIAEEEEEDDEEAELPVQAVSDRSTLSGTGEGAAMDYPSAVGASISYAIVEKEHDHRVDGDNDSDEREEKMNDEDNNNNNTKEQGDKTLKRLYVPPPPSIMNSFNRTPSPLSAHLRAAGGAGGPGRKSLVVLRPRTSSTGSGDSKPSSRSSTPNDGNRDGGGGGNNRGSRRFSIMKNVKVRRSIRVGGNALAAATGFIARERARTASSESCGDSTSGNGSNISVKGSSYRKGSGISGLSAAVVLSPAVKPPPPSSSSSTFEKKTHDYKHATEEEEEEGEARSAAAAAHQQTRPAFIEHPPNGTRTSGSSSSSIRQQEERRASSLCLKSIVRRPRREGFIVLADDFEEAEFAIGATTTTETVLAASIVVSAFDYVIGNMCSAVDKDYDRRQMLQHLIVGNGSEDDDDYKCDDDDDDGNEGESDDEECESDDVSSTRSRPDTDSRMADRATTTASSSVAVIARNNMNFSNRRGYNTAESVASIASASMARTRTMSGELAAALEDEKTAATKTTTALTAASTEAIIQGPNEEEEAEDDDIESDSDDDDLDEDDDELNAIDANSFQLKTENVYVDMHAQAVFFYKGSFVFKPVGEVEFLCEK